MKCVPLLLQWIYLAMLVIIILFLNWVCVCVNAHTHAYLWVSVGACVLWHTFGVRGQCLGIFFSSILWDPGIKIWSLGLQASALPAEPSFWAVNSPILDHDTTYKLKSSSFMVFQFHGHWVFRVTLSLGWSDTVTTTISTFSIYVLLAEYLFFKNVAA